MPNVKVVLIKDVPSLGEIGDVASVSAGYARNYLLPRGFAVTATAKRLDDTHFQQELTDRREAAARAEAEGIAAALQGQAITIAVVVGDQGRMHGQITNQDVAAAIHEQVGVEGRPARPPNRQSHPVAGPLSAPDSGRGRRGGLHHPRGDGIRGAGGRARRAGGSGVGRAGGAGTRLRALARRFLLHTHSFLR